MPRHISVYASIAVVAAAGASVWVMAAPGTLEPPSSEIVGSGHTLTEIYDAIQALNGNLGAGSVAGREVIFSNAIAEGSTFVVEGSGSAILWSATAHTGAIELKESSLASPALARVWAQATLRNGLQYDSSYQEFFGVQVQLPLEVTAVSGINQSSSFQLVITRLTNR